MNNPIVIRRTKDDYLIKQEAIASLQERLLDMDCRKSKETILAAIAKLERESQEIRKSILLSVTL